MALPSTGPLRQYELTKLDCQASSIWSGCSAASRWSRPIRAICWRWRHRWRGFRESSQRLGVFLRPDCLRPITAHLEPRVIVAVALFIMAWSLESRSLLQALLRPWPALWAWSISYSAVPALAWSVGWLLPAIDLRLGLLIMASVPCTLASAVLWTRMAGGNEATALFTVLGTTLLSWLATTAWLTATTGTLVDIAVGPMMLAIIFA